MQLIENVNGPIENTGIEGTDAVDRLWITLRICVYSTWELDGFGITLRGVSRQWVCSRAAYLFG